MTECANVICAGFVRSQIVDNVRCEVVSFHCRREHGSSMPKCPPAFRTGRDGDREWYQLANLGSQQTLY